MTKRKTYTKEFKLEAVRLFEAGDKDGVSLARELGIRRNQLYKWQKELQDKGSEAFGGAGRRPASKDGELARLRRENARLQEENEILKKAAVDSIGQCNTSCLNDEFGVKNGTTRATRVISKPKTRSMEKMEIR